MPSALINALALAAESCPELEAWRVCEVARDGRCELCRLGGYDRCEAQVVKALARRVAALTEEAT
jgi:hypothetical protein